MLKGNLFDGLIKTCVVSEFSLTLPQAEMRTCSSRG